MLLDIIRVNSQPDCVFIATSDKIPECKLEVWPMQSVTCGFERTICTLESQDLRTLKKAYEYMKEHPQSKNVRIVSKEDTAKNGTKKWEVNILLKTSNLYKDIRDYGGFVLGTMEVEEGKEEWVVTFGDLCIRQKALDLLKDSHDIRVLKNVEIPSEFFAWITKVYEDLNNLFHLSKELSFEQKILLRKLIMNGYYDWPRKTNITSLAKEYNLTKSAMSRRIRVLEKSILENTIKLILKK